MGIRKGAVALAATLALAACQTPQGPALQGGLEAGSPDPAGTPLRRTGPVPPLAALRGASPDRLELLLGAPTLRRRDRGVELWQYAAPECTLLLFLYPPEGGGGPLSVTYLEAAPGGVTEAALTACVAAAAHRPLPATS